MDLHCGPMNLSLPRLNQDAPEGKMLRFVYFLAPKARSQTHNKLPAKLSVDAGIEWKYLSMPSPISSSPSSSSSSTGPSVPSSPSDSSSKGGKSRPGLEVRASVRRELRPGLEVRGSLLRGRRAGLEAVVKDSDDSCKGRPRR